MAKLLKAGTEIRRLKGTTFTEWPAWLNKPQTKETAPTCSSHCTKVCQPPMLLKVGPRWRAEVHSTKQQTLSRVCCKKSRRSVFKLKEGTFRLDIRKRFYMIRVMKQWHWLPREVMDALETSSVRLDRVWAPDGAVGTPVHHRGIGSDGLWCSLPTHKKHARSHMLCTLGSVQRQQCLGTSPPESMRERGTPK